MLIFTARRRASAVYAVIVCPSVRHKPVLCQNDWTNELILHGCFLPPIPLCVIRKIGPKLGSFPR